MGRSGPRRVLRVVVFLVTSTVLVPAVPLVPPDAAAVPRNAPIGELVERRTERSRTVRNADGKLTTTVSGVPMHYRDAAGRLQPIDTELAATGDKGFPWRNRADSFTARFRSHTGADHVRVAAGGREVGMTLQQAAPGTATVEGSSITYGKVFPAADLVYDVLPGSVKETVVLHDRTAPPAYVFRLATVDGSPLRAEAMAGGTWDVSSADEQRLFTLEAPRARDSQGGEELTSSASNASMQVVQVGGALDVTLAVDPVWLAAPDRRFPVLLDPTISIQALTLEGVFEADCASCPVWSGWSRFEIGTSDDDVWRSAMQFDLADIPAGASLSQAKFEVYFENHCITTATKLNCTQSIPHALDVHRMTTAWTNASTAQNMAFDPTALSSVTLSDTEHKWLSWNVTSTVQNWVAGTQPNFGLLLKRATEPYGAGGIRPPGAAYQREATLFPRLVLTYSGDAVDLLEPDTLHSNGAELRWTKYTGPTGAPFDRYEVHRSSTARFTPSSSTLLTTIRDINITSYRDTSAAPSKPFSYRIVANTSMSNERRVTLPADGRATKILQPGPGEAADAYFTKSSGFVNCHNNGKRDRMYVGSTSTSTRRSALRFDLRGIPAGATVDQAVLSVWHPDGRDDINTINVHRVTRGWEEGTGVNTQCTGDGVTWYEVGGGVRWTTEGGDFDPSASAGWTSTAAESHDWHKFYFSWLVQDWVDGDVPNHGLILKLADETPDLYETLTYWSADYTVAPTLRPKLVVTYTDGSHAVAPSVAVNSPAPNSTVRGNTVSVSVGASDDRRVDKVELLADGTVVGTDTVAPYSFLWDSTTKANGAHTLSAKAYDDAGNTATSTGVPVTVDNNGFPTVSVSPPTAGSYASAVQADAPRAWWRLGESSGTTASDSSGNLLHGSWSGATPGAPGALAHDNNSAGNFSGIENDDVIVNDNDALDFGTSNFTAEAWVKTTVNEERTVMGKYDGGGLTPNWRFTVTDDDGLQGLVRVLLCDGVTVGTYYGPPTRVDDGKWHHVMVAFDRPSGVRIYVDGMERIHTHTVVGSVSNTAPLRIGDSSGYPALQGEIDEPAVYPTALSAARAVAHYDAGVVRNAYTVNATAGDDVGVSKVEFYADDVRFAEDTTAPYSATLDTLAAGNVVYDGTRVLTAKAYDTSGQVTTSASVPRTVGNTAHSKYRASFTTTPVPSTAVYDPALSVQEKAGVDVTVTNTSATTWAQGSVQLRYRWVSQSTVVDAAGTAFPVSVPGGSSVTQRLLIDPPTLDAGTDRKEWRLVFDLFEPATSTWFAAKGNQPIDNPVIVNKVVMAGLGLERFYQYTDDQLGAGMSHMVNVASGNSLLQWTPFSSPGRGISTLVNLTYNSLEDNNNSPLNSPAGNNFSLGISSLTRLGTMLDIHPNNADTIAGRANRWIAFVDGDGTRHRFEGRQATDGTVYWEEPAGVHLYLRQFSTTDATRKWALTRPDGVTFFFDADGHPTAVEDRNGNRLSFTLSNVDPGDDPGGPRKRVTAVVDAGGRAYEIDYYTKGEVQKAQLRGKVQRLTDHTGNALEFQYYEDGNLLRLTEKGGTKADGSFLADRTFVFTYTTSAGDGPAIPDANARVNPNPRTSPQSTRLYSVRDPRGNETRFAYYGPTSGQLRWKLASRTDRAGKATSYSYDLVTRRTTVAAPMSRTTVYAYDAEGKVTGITNPKNETTTLSWTLDRHVSRITEPTTAYTEMAYNNNGYLTDVWDQLRNHTSMEYSNTTADANDVSGKWKAGRTTPHLSKLVKKTQPKGMATATPANDFQWSFSYDPKGNLTGVTDPEGKPTTYQRNPDGSIASVTSANSHTTSFTYEASGLVASITDAKSKVSRFGYDADGLLLWTQDANHQNDTGTNPREYRTYFDYDSFGRLGRQSSPKSTGSERGTLVWQAVDFDANDNVELRIAPHFGVDYAGSGARTTARYDPMDRVTLVTGPDTTADPAGERQTFTYDDAGRLATRTAPRGVQSTNTNQDFTDFFTYDGVDRVVKQARHEVDGNGAVVRTLYSHLCYDLAGDLRRAVSPRANVSTVDCNAALPQPFTTSYTYDVAHRRLTETDPLSHTRSQSYDAHNNIATSTDENGHVTTFTYDQRDLPVKMVEPFVTGTTPRNLTTRIEYDNVGNKKRLITPRAWDASSDKATFTQYVTTFQYDELDRLTRIDLPTSSTYSQQLYVHREYDPVGNMVTSTASDSSATLSLVPAAKKTVVAYFDTGWVRTTKEGTAARVHFDYTAEGQQSTRTPEGTGGVVDPSQKMVWSYYPDGMLKENKDRNGHGTRYAYDADNNLTSAGGDSGVIDPRESRLDIEAVYDSLDRLSKARAKKQSETNWRFTRMEYDLNDNVANRFDDGVETTAGALVTSPRQVKFDYDGADWLTTMTDFGPSVDAVDDQVVETLFTATGKERDRKLFKKDALGNRVLNQQTTWDHFANGKLKTLVTKNGAGATLESHTVGYEDPAGIYVNGNRTKDTFTLAGPNTSAACRTTPCTATYTYDAQDRLVNENNGHGGVTNYTLDEAGNIKSEAVTRSGSTATETFEYSGNRLIRTSGVGAARRYHHDPDGNLDCVTTDTGSPSDCNTPTGQSVSPRLLADYHYDYLNRMDQYRSYTTNGTTSTADDSADYVLDALNRVVEQTETHSGTTRTTKFSYVGLSGQVSQETHSNATGVTATKTYGYDAFGHRITMGNDPGLPGPTGGSNEQFSYAYDVHGSVSLLVNGTGQARASYGYRPYGEKDTDLTKGDEVDDNPFNPYRYTAKRFDSGSGSLDMGARRFGPDINRFLQMDQYSGALADLRLGTDPLTGNRYGLAGGNPLSYIEWDGHVVYRDGEGAGSATPQETYQPTLAEIVTNPLYPLRPAPPPSFEEVQARAREYEEKQWLRDEIAKGNQTGDNGTQFRYYDIEKQPGRGQVQVDFFIRSRTSGLIIKGDSRGFTAERDKSSRVRIEFDFEQGYAKTTVFESCTSVALRCDEAEGVGGLINQVDVEEGSNGSITVKYDAANSITLGPSVDGRVTLLPRPDGRFNVRTHRDPYPSLEIYQYRGSRIDVLAREGQTYSLWGATPLSPDKREDHTPYQLT